MPILLSPKCLPLFKASFLYFLLLSKLTFETLRTIWHINILFKKLMAAHPAGIYLLKVNNRNTRTRCEVCSKITIKTLERRHKMEHLVITIITKSSILWRRSAIFIVNFEHISHLALIFLLLTWWM